MILIDILATSPPTSSKIDLFSIEGVPFIVVVFFFSLTGYFVLSTRRHEAKNLNELSFPMSQVVLKAVTLFFSLYVLIIEIESDWPAIQSPCTLLLLVRLVIFLSWIVFIICLIFPSKVPAYAKLIGYMEMTTIQNTTVLLLYGIMIVFCLLDITQLRLLPWKKNRLTSLGAGLPCVFLIKLIYFSTTLSSLMQLVSSIINLISQVSLFNILFLVFALLAAIVDIFAVSLYVQAAYYDKLSVEVVEKDKSVDNMQHIVNVLKSKHYDNNVELRTVGIPGRFIDNPLVFPKSDIKQIDWKDISLDKTADSKILGSGSFGIVFQALWRRTRHGTEVKEKVAIKVIRQGIKCTGVANSSGSAGFEKQVQAAYQEAEVMYEADKHELVRDCIVKLHGIAAGPLPHELTSQFGIPAGEIAVGIVLRYEAGGSLELHLHGDAQNHRVKVKLQMTEKLRILSCVARGVAELHDAGIVHGDLKPGNILLSEHTPPLVRLGDFGLADFRDFDDTTFDNSLVMTSVTKGTALYCAPEMFFNPFDNTTGVDQRVARASRKTDVYALGMIIWEFLTGDKPFDGISNEVALATKLHKGIRPPLDVLTTISVDKGGGNTPPSVIELIKKCFQESREARPTAVECYSVLQHAYLISSEGKFDIFFSHAWITKPFLSQICLVLTRHGYRVWYDQNDMGYDLHKSMKDGVDNSTVFLACINTVYQKSKNCMFELEHAFNSVPPKTTVVLSTEPHTLTITGPFSYATEEIKDKCRFSSTMFVDVGKIASQDWNRPDGPSNDMLQDLTDALAPMLQILRDIGCNPSMLQ